MNKSLLEKIILIIFMSGGLYFSLNRNINNIFLFDKFHSVIMSIGNKIPRLSNNDCGDILGTYYNKSLEEEISDLKDLLKLNKTLSEFNPVNATVIFRNDIYWNNVIKIDRGIKDGIVRGNAVVTSRGMIGVIDKVYYDSSDVKLLTTDDITYRTSVIIRIDNRDYYAVLNGYDEYNNLLKVSAIDKSINIKKGDKVITSGLGSVPKGLFVGTVKSREVDKYNLGQILYIRPSNTFNDIRYVSVLKVSK